MTGAIVIASLTFAGVLVGAVIYVVKVILDLHDDLRLSDRAMLDTTKTLRDVDTLQRDVERNLRDTTATLDSKILELERERDARKRAERHRDSLLVEIAKNGDPDAVIEAINAELTALSELSTRRSP